MRQDDVSLFFTLLLQQFGYLCELRFQFFLQLGRKVVVNSLITDFHERNPPYLRTRRWWVDGIRMSSRYLATVRRVTSIPSACSRSVMCSSVSGWPESSSSIIFLTLRFRIN